MTDTLKPADEFLGSACASRALSGAPPEWDRQSCDPVIRSEFDLEEKFLYICGNPWNSKIVDPNDDYLWLWTPDMSSAGAPTARGARALPKT